VDKYNVVKLAWHRFEQWERKVFLRAKEWRIPVDGTAEEFQNRLGNRVTVVPKEEFFKRYKKRKTVEILGFCDGDEFALKLPNSQKRLVHYLHGVFVHGPDFDYVYAQYRFLHHKNRRFLKNNHAFLFGIIFLLVSAISAYAVESLTDAPAIGLFTFGALLFGVIFLAPTIVAGPLIWLNLMRINRRDRHMCEKTYQLLEEICGNPPRTEP
jgi:hypothetical protein